MLSKLVKGQEVLVLANSTDDSVFVGCDKYTIGELMVLHSQGGSASILRRKDGSDREIHIYRKHLLAIGDKVERGPDMHKGCSIGDDYDDSKGVVTGFHDNDGRNVVVKWEHKPNVTTYFRMTADHQDLKPTGDSVGVEDGKPEERPFQVHDYVEWQQGEQIAKRGHVTLIEDGNQKIWFKQPGKDYATWSNVRNFTLIEPVKETNKPKPIKENDMSTEITREQRAVKKDEEVRGIEDDMANAIVAHKEAMAVKEENAAALKADAKRLRDHTTDYAATIDDIKIAHKLTNKQAEAAYRLSKKGITIKV